MNTATSSIRAGLPPGPKGTLIGGNIRQFRAGILNFSPGAFEPEMKAIAEWFEENPPGRTGVGPGGEPRRSRRIAHSPGAIR